MRAIVTGGAGFIGSHVVDALLARGDDVLVVDDLSAGRRENVSQRARFLELDVREPFAHVFAEHQPDVCFHLAAKVDVNESVRAPHEDAAVNVVGTVNVLAGASKVGCRVVFASSGGAIYGEAPVPVDETAPEVPVSPYGCAKLVGDEYLRMYTRLDHLPHVSLRFANVYGPRQRSDTEAAVVGVFLTRMARDEQPRIFGDGLQTRDFVYVGDAVDAMLRASGTTAGGIYNIGTGVATSVLDLYERCAQIAGWPGAAQFAPARAGELHDNVLDATRARAELDWQPATSLDGGLGRVWEWVLSA